MPNCKAMQRRRKRSPKCKTFSDSSSSNAGPHVQQKSPKIQDHEMVSLESLEKQTRAQYDKLIDKFSQLKLDGDRCSIDEFTEYADDVHQYLKKMELKCILSEDFLSKENDITKNIRAILLDWLIQVQCCLHLQDETLHLTVAFLDRFLSISSVHLEKLQLLGITCLLLASKVEERYPPDVNTLRYLTDYSYSKEAVLQMEMIILRTLCFDFCLPTSVSFYHLYVNSTAFQLNDCKTQLVIDLGKYLMDLGILSTRVLPFPPSKRAAAALALAMKIFMTGDKPKYSTWTSQLACATGFTEENLVPCMRILASLLVKAPRAKQTAAWRKYGSVSKYGGLSQLPMLTKSPAVQQLLKM
ncbi:G2/mitotic-specific cyclin-B-like [Ptychodera flava]|uniref:G2/mitotic-specific cyclin-B-like n=1 Tax=Ptychodera flava TaxID=63121 RepID=UPI003969CB51